jgi:hypothetical protein
VGENEESKGYIWFVYFLNICEYRILKLSLVILSRGRQKREINEGDDPY